MTRLFSAKPFIIAEVGSNWTTKAEALHSITSAMCCGADAVKFQLFSEEALYGFPTQTLRHVLSVDWLPELARQAKERGIEFMCTAFSPELVAAVDPYVSVHKVASSDLNYPQLLEAVAKTGKPVIISKGGHPSNQDLKCVEGMLPCKPIFLSCTAAYPSDYADLTAIEWQSSDGLSDHTLGYSAAVYAAKLGATVIEKHFTAFPDLDTPDRPHSLTPEQFKRMVDIIRGREVESEETAMQLRHKRRLIATKDVNAGAVLTYGVNYGAYRSLEDDTRGASPFLWRELEGKVVKGDIPRGKGIALEDCE